MKCPYCSKIDNKVIDSRLSKDGRMIRRWRECIACERRFTTYEKLEEVLPMVIKKDGRREPFSRNGRTCSFAPDGKFLRISASAKSSRQKFPSAQ